MPRLYAFLVLARLVFGAFLGELHDKHVSRRTGRARYRFVLLYIRIVPTGRKFLMEQPTFSNQ